MGRRPELRYAEQTVDHLDQFSGLVRDAEMTAPSRKQLLQAIEKMKSNLDRLERDIDSVRLPDAFFDPSEPKLIGYFIALALISQERVPLGEIEPFYGAGIYAIYYLGANPLYARISKSETPIYVGKADPPKSAARLIDQGTKLYARLNEHRKNIASVSGIIVGEFECRALAVQSGYQSTAESHLINLFRPIWNNETKVLFGIGKHGDLSTTRKNTKSPWDALHPGRPWASDSKPGKTVAEIESEVEEHFKDTPVFDQAEDVFAAFVDGIRLAGRLEGSDVR